MIRHTYLAFIFIKIYFILQFLKFICWINYQDCKDVVSQWPLSTNYLKLKSSFQIYFLYRFLYILLHSLLYLKFLDKHKQAFFIFHPISIIHYFNIDFQVAQNTFSLFQLMNHLLQFLLCQHTKYFFRFHGNRELSFKWSYMALQCIKI